VAGAAGLGREITASLRVEARPESELEEPCCGFIATFCATHDVSFHTLYASIRYYY